MKKFLLALALLCAGMPLARASDYRFNLNEVEHDLRDLSRNVYRTKAFFLREVAAVASELEAVRSTRDSAAARARLAILEKLSTFIESCDSAYVKTRVLPGLAKARLAYERVYGDSQASLGAEAELKLASGALGSIGMDGEPALREQALSLRKKVAMKIAKARAGTLDVRTEIRDDMDFQQALGDMATALRKRKDLAVYAPFLEALSASRM